jgi:prepilin-type N-terminal cleavage/methylation domain-containing protein
MARHPSLRQLRAPRGISLIEVLVVMVIMGVLAAILFPIFSRAQNRAHAASCTGNLRQLGQGVRLYMLDSGAHFPGARWTADLERYIERGSVTNCPAVGDREKASYALNGQLVRLNGTGIGLNEVKDTSSVGLFVDCAPQGLPYAPVIDYWRSADDTPQDRHGLLIAYCDGHVSVTPRGADITRLDGLYARAYTHAGVHGLLDNPEAGVIPPTSATAGACTVAGATLAEPLWQAAKGGWVQAKGEAPTLALTGMASASAASPDLLCAAGIAPGAGRIIATEAYGLVVARHGVLTGRGIRRSEIAPLFTATAEFQGATSVFVYAPTREMRRLFEEIVTGTPGGTLAMRSDAVTVASVDELMLRVGESSAVGYAPLGLCDLSRVSVVPMLLGDGSKQVYTRDAVTTGVTGSGGWSLQVPIVARNVSGTPTAQALLAYVGGPDFARSLALRSRYFPPKATLADYGL